MFFSPDGRFVAYDLPSVDAGNQRDVYVMAVDGSREIPAVVDPNQDIVMGWSPDGRFLLFASDRSGSMSLWALPFRAGKPQAAPELLKSDIGTFESSMGITAAGALYVGKTGRSRSVEVASVDWAAGKLLTPLPVRRFVPSLASPSWSSDGKFLCCVSMPDPSGAKVLAIFSLDTGQVVRESHPRMGFVSSAQLAPDGRSFAVQGIDLKGRSGIFQVEALSGEVTSIAVSEERGEGRPEGLGNPAWSPDGKKLFYQKLSPDPQQSRSIAFIEKDLVSGKEREIIRRTNLGNIWISPDGRWIATPSSDQATKSATVVLIPLDGGEPRELLRVKQPSQFRILGWAPDSGAVIVWKILTNESTLTEANSSHEVWRIPIGAEQPRKLEIDMRTLKASGPVAFSPDGRHLAYLVTGDSTSEVSVVENMLPALGSKK
jgi:tricorn protease